MLSEVVEVQEATESRGQIRNRRLDHVVLWKVWILTLACGHKEKRRAEHPEPPKKVKCARCTKEHFS
jgi:hypothetical protein